MGSARKKQQLLAFEVRRGTIVKLKRKGFSKALPGSCDLGVVVSNDVQNEASDFVLVVPLERRRARIKAPFAVDLGRSAGFRELHTARCDWVCCVSKNDISAIERIGLRDDVMQLFDDALRTVLFI